MSGRSAVAAVAIVLLFSALLAFGLGTASGSNAGDEGVVSAAAAPEVVSEVTEKRTATSRTFRLSNGQLETLLFQEPVNYRDAEGDWQPIEEQLEELPSGDLTNSANSFDLHLPEQMGEAPVRLEDDEGWVSYRLLGEETGAAEVDGSIAAYEAREGGVSFELQSIAQGLKEEIVLNDSSQPGSYRFSLATSSELSPSLVADGSIEIRDADGGLFATLPAPTVSDDTGLSGPVAYHLDSLEGGEWNLAVVVDHDWLSDSARRFPVTIDPTITTVGANQDCTIGSLPAPAGWKTCGASGGTELTAAYSQKENQKIRSLLRFDVWHVIPSDAYLDKAILSLYAPKAAENTPGLETRRLTKTWTTDLNWEKFSSQKQDLWSTPGGDFTTEGQAQILTSQRGSQAGWWDFSSESLRTLVADWIAEKTANQGVIVKQTNETKTECEANPVNCNRRFVAFNSTASASSELKPKLKLTYYLQAPTSSTITSPAEGTVTARRLKLKASWTQGGVTGVTFQFREAGKGNFQTIPPELVRDANGSAVSWPIAISGVQETKPLFFDAAHATETLRKKGGAVQIRALFNGSAGVEGVNAPVEATVDRFLGGPADAVASVGPGSVDLLTGNFTVSKGDVFVPAFISSLDFTRTFNSRDVDLSKVQDHGESPYEREMKKVLGPGWSPGVPVEEAGAGAWRSIRLVETSEVIEGETYSFAYALLTSLDGTESSFEREEGGSNYITPDELSGMTLSKNASGQFVLDNGKGEKVIFANNAGSADYLPAEVVQAGSSANTTKMAYAVVNGSRRLTKIVAPSPPGVTCTTENATTEPGCKALTFTYTTYGYGDRLTSIRYYGANASGMTNVNVAQFEYTTEGWLKAAWDPRISPLLKETYTYTAGGQIATITPPGQQPWTMEYGIFDEEEANGRLIAVKRSTLLSSPAVAQTTIVYGVPLSGGSAPYSMSAAEVAKWGQTVIPVDATAIFDPSQVPANPPSSYSGATLYYMDSEGGVVNTASSAGAGTTSPSITTLETDEFGNVVRELTAQNRLRALEAGEGKSKARSEQIDTRRQFSPDGTELREEWGPLHKVQIAETSKAAEARAHTTIEYEQGLPVRETTGANVAGLGVDPDQRVVETKYDPVLLSPTETIVDPTGLAITRITKYDQNTGLPIETRQPSAPNGKAAGATKTVYYTHEHGGECKLEAYAGLPCKIEPASQPETAGQPQLPVKRFLSYNQFGEPLEVTETVGGGGTRKTVNTYDTAGRQKTKELTGAGASIPKVETLYSSTLGVPTTQRFVCPESEPGCDTQATTTTYDALGRATKYQDADGVTTEATLDFLGRPVTVYDGKGTQTMKYDSATGLLVELEDSAAGKFTASYNADGQLVKRGLPNGLTGETTYDETGAPIGLSYTKASNCGLSCNWLNFAVERSINGQILLETGTSGKDEYAYDKLGRLVAAKETPTGGSCTTRAYVYDKDSNRTEMTTTPGTLGVCSSSGGATQKYSYDSADRLLREGLAYDDFGRITSLPASLAGGKALSTTYFSNELVATQAQNGVTNTFQLDSTLRQRQRLQAGGLEGIEVFHYSGPGDSPTWTQRGSTWTRNILGVGGELAAMQESGKEVELQLTDLGGDIAAKAALSPAATELTKTFRYDEFGNSMSGDPGRFGWLGGPQRRKELPSGVTQMGARSYVPQMGRLLSTDPISGGSANPYDYANQDPVNSADLSGLKPWDKDQIGEGTCEGQLHVYSYGAKFHAKYRAICVADGYRFFVRKIQKYFMKHTTSGYSLPGHSFEVVKKSEHLPDNPGGAHWQKEFGNWNSQSGATFDCTIDIEYQYLMFILIRWVYEGGVLPGTGDDAFPEEGGGTLELKAQEVCGHGSY